MTGLELRGVAKRHGPVVALDGVDLAVARGEVRALLGPNGAGKSTLVSLAAGLAAPDAGEVAVDGGPVRRGGRPVPGRTGLAPQDLGVYPTLTVGQNLRFFAELAGLRPGAARRRAGEVADRLALTPLLDRLAGRLSGGEQRRLHTAAAVVGRAGVLLLDEPTAGADVEARSAILSVVAELAAGGAAVVYTTHYLPEVEELGAGVSVLARGRVVAEGTVAELVSAHASPTLEVELDLAGPGHPGRALAEVAAGTGAEVRGARLVLACPDPAAALPGLLGRLGGAASAVRAVEVGRPSLEAAYRALTGAPR